MTTFWPYPTNYSNGTEVSGVADFFFNFPIHIMGGQFSMGLTILIWITSFTLSLQSGTSKAITVASFISLIFSLWILGITGGVLNMFLVFLFLGLTILGAVSSYAEGGNL